MKKNFLLVSMLFTVGNNYGSSGFNPEKVLIFGPPLVVGGAFVYYAFGPYSGLWGNRQVVTNGNNFVAVTSSLSTSDNITTNAQATTTQDPEALSSSIRQEAVIVTDQPQVQTQPQQEPTAVGFFAKVGSKFTSFKRGVKEKKDAAKSAVGAKATALSEGINKKIVRPAFRTYDTVVNKPLEICFGLPYRPYRTALVTFCIAKGMLGVIHEPQCIGDQIKALGCAGIIAGAAFYYDSKSIAERIRRGNLEKQVERVNERLQAAEDRDLQQTMLIGALHMKQDQFKEQQETLQVTVEDNATENQRLHEGAREQRQEILLRQAQILVAQSKMQDAFEAHVLQVTTHLGVIEQALKENRALTQEEIQEIKNLLQKEVELNKGRHTDLTAQMQLIIKVGNAMQAKGGQLSTAVAALSEQVNEHGQQLSRLEGSVIQGTAAAEKAQSAAEKTQAVVVEMNKSIQVFITSQSNPTTSPAVVGTQQRSSNDISVDLSSIDWSKFSKSSPMQKRGQPSSFETVTA